MKVTLEPGTYVVAVSGGVDSVALLHMLHKQPGLKLVVAHFDHGIRDDSALDRKHVQQLAKNFGLPFVYGEGNLGDTASEARARKARYEFLDNVKKVAGAHAIITAHHQDDALETAILNMLRGTGRRGLSSLRSLDGIKRPILHLNKNQLRDYAREQGLTWREDKTNRDLRYIRNYVRHRIIPRLDGPGRVQLHKTIERMAELNDQIDALLINHLHLHPALDKLDRHTFTMLPHAVAMEVIAAWLRRHGVRQFDKKTLERLVAACKTYKPGAKVDVNKQVRITVSADSLALTAPDR